MKRPFEVVCDTTDIPAWLAARGAGIGASEAAIVMGDSHRNEPVELWAWKTGREDPPDLDGIEYVELGHKLEPMVIATYAEYSKRPIARTPDTIGRFQWNERTATDYLYALSFAAQRRTQLLRSREWPWLLATLDAWARHEVMGPIPLEAKKTAGWNADDWEHGPPLHIWWQCQQQMAVTGAPMCSVACLIGNRMVRWQDVQRDNEAIGRLVNVSRAFWTCVENDEAPAHRPTRASIRVLYPAGSEDKEALVQLPDARWLELDAERERLRLAEKDAKTKRAQLEAELCDAIGDSGVAVLGDGTSYAWRSHVRAAYEVEEKTVRRLTRRKAPKSKRRS